MLTALLILRSTSINSFVGKNKVQHSVWKSLKMSHSILRAKRATFTFRVDKSESKMPKIVHFASFWKTESLGQTVLPDRSFWIGQKLLENAKFKYDILGHFRTLCRVRQQVFILVSCTKLVRFWLGIGWMVEASDSTHTAVAELRNLFLLFLNFFFHGKNQRQIFEFIQSIHDNFHNPVYILRRKGFH